MQIVLSDYQVGEVVQVAKEYLPNQLDMEFIDLVYTQPIQMRGTVEKGLDILNFRGELTTAVEHTCGRCLKKVAGGVRKHFDLIYDIKDKEVIETTDDLREVLLLEHDVTFLCSKDCKGLCPQCGTDLNETKCQCPPHSEETNFVSLKDIWKKKKEDKQHGKS